MADTYISKINGHLVKDTEARDAIAHLEEWSQQATENDVNFGQRILTLENADYVTNAKLEQILGSYVNDIDALLGG